MSIWSWVLLALGVVSAVAVLNTRWPRRSLLLVASSWFLAWALIELAPQALLLGAIVACVSIARGGLSHLLGVIGLALWAVSVLAAMPLVLSAVRVRVDVQGRPSDLDISGGPRVPRSHLLLPLLGLLRPGVRLERGRVDATVGRRKLKLDVYRARHGEPGARPAVINVHGGAWVSGTRREQGRPLLNHLALNGWVAFNIDYRLSPRATIIDQVADVKRAIAWVRANAQELGVAPDFVALTGGSAGGHLCALAALTGADRSLQPGFEEADVSVQAAVPFYGVYDLTDAVDQYPPALEWLVRRWVVKADPEQEPELYRRISPIARVNEDAPPFLVVHGSADTLVPVGEFRRFVERLRDVSHEPVLSIEMPGAQHAFDVLPSWRTLPVIEAIERFLHACESGRGPGTEDVEQRLEGELTG